MSTEEIDNDDSAFYDGGNNSQSKNAKSMPKSSTTSLSSVGDVVSSEIFKSVVKLFVVRWLFYIHF